MRKRSRGTMDRILEYGAMAATGAALRKVPIPGVARFAVTPLLLRVARNRRARNILLALVAAGLIATLLTDYTGRDEPEEWDEPY